MRTLITISIFIFLNFKAFAQNKMRPVNELINNQESGWTLVTQWINTAKNKVEVLPILDSTSARDALYKTQVTTRSPMGAIVYMTGGLLIDGGWIRILGSGSLKMKRSLPDWNKGKAFNEFGQTPGFLLIADDVLGGFFILNGGALGKDLGKVYYFSPQSLIYEPLDISYSDFLIFCFNGNLDEFYQSLRWENWRKDVQQLNADEVYSFFPFLFSKEASDINKIYKNPIPVEEQYFFNLEIRKQLNIDSI